MDLLQFYRRLYANKTSRDRLYQIHEEICHNRNPCHTNIRCMGIGCYECPLDPEPLDYDVRHEAITIREEDILAIMLLE